MNGTVVFVGETKESWKCKLGKKTRRAKLLFFVIFSVDGNNTIAAQHG